MKITFTDETQTCSGKEQVTRSPQKSSEQLLSYWLLYDSNHYRRQRQIRVPDGQVLLVKQVTHNRMALGQNSWTIDGISCKDTKQADGLIDSHIILTTGRCNSRTLPWLNFSQMVWWM